MESPIEMYIGFIPSLEYILGSGLLKFIWRQGHKGGAAGKWGESYQKAHNSAMSGLNHSQVLGNIPDPRI